MYSIIPVNIRTSYSNEDLRIWIKNHTFNGDYVLSACLRCGAIVSGIDGYIKKATITQSCTQCEHIVTKTGE